MELDSCIAEERYYISLFISARLNLRALRMSNVRARFVAGRSTLARRTLLANC